MKKNLLSENLIHTQGNGINTRCLGYKSGLYVRVIEIDGFSRIMIELGSDVGWKEIKEIVPQALEWNKLLNKTQLPLNGFLLEMFLEQHKKGVSYRDIALQINKDIANGIIESQENKYALIIVYSTLQVMKMKFEEIDLVVKEGVKNAEKGLPPFDSTEYPVNRKKVISVLEWWRKKTKNVKRAENSLSSFFTVNAKIIKRRGMGS